MCSYPEDTSEEMSFDSVVVYDVAREYFKNDKATGAVKVAIVTYGNGVRTALQYAHTQAREAKQQQQQIHITVIDSPCISQTPAQLRLLLPRCCTPQCTALKPFQNIYSSLL
jgi:hypothetical protein